MNNYALNIINDGSGDQCGFSYKDRVALAKMKNTFSAARGWVNMTHNAVNWHERQGYPDAVSAVEVLKIATEVAEYYARHVAEMEG